MDGAFTASPDVGLWEVTFAAQDLELSDNGGWAPRVGCWGGVLRQLNVVDTPGTNVILERQQKITEEFVPRADLVLFVISADRPFTESEARGCGGGRRIDWARIRPWNAH